MRRVNGVVGNADDDPDLAAAVADHEAAGTLETVVLTETERKRSRLRVTTNTGTDLGVLVDQPELTAGSVLLCDEERAVVITVETREAVVIEFPAAEVAVSTAVELGHRIGNQHWDITIEDTTIYIPVEADRAIIEDVLTPYIPAAATIRYETVDAGRFVDSRDDDTTGGGPNTSRDHAEHSYDSQYHEHERDHEHSHEHDHETDPKLNHQQESIDDLV